MSLWKQITRFAQDPAPNYVFELSEAGIAYSANGRAGFAEFPEKTLVASPIEDNLLSADVASQTIQRIASPGGAGKKRRPAAVILPDYSVRVSLLDFDSFPSAPEEQLALVRFRVKKTVPFDIESAAVSYYIQPGTGGKKKADVVAVTVAFEILARYEALFRSVGFHPGDVTSSSLAALELYREQGVVVIAKLAGNVVTVMAMADGRLKLFRCLTLEEVTDEELLGVLHPTFAYVEDELSQPVSKLMLCGFARAPEGISVPTETLRSRIGPVNGFNAGLLGYLEAVQ
jgi:type IV pilus assembly protein PilM